MLPIVVSALGIALSPPTRGGSIGSEHMAQLRSRGFAVVENFLAPPAVSELVADVEALRSEGRFAAAGVGEAATNRLDKSVRKCEQCFVFPKGRQQGAGDARARDRMYSSIDAVHKALHEGAGTPLDALLTEGLYVHYPNGGYYKRHVDAAVGTTSALRAWSYLLYLNEDWCPADGGCLRIFTDGGLEQAPAGAPPSFVDVEPRGGTLVVFRSDAVPHEVLETTTKRMALVGWFSKPVEGSSSRRSLITALSGALVVGSAVKFGPSLLGGGK